MEVQRFVTCLVSDIMQVRYLIRMEVRCPVSDSMEVCYPTTATLTNLFEPYSLAEWVQPDVAASEHTGLAVCP